MPFKFNRTEFGVRVESPSDIGFLCRKERPDVKYIWENEFGEIRTFCTCRDGEIWNIPYHNGLSALSGRSDGPLSGFSNFGLLVRINKSASLGNEVLRNVFDNEAIKNGNAIYQSLHEFLNNSNDSSTDSIKNRPWFPKESFKKGKISDFIGDKCAGLLKEALTNILKESPDLYDHRTMLVFPSIEGVGDCLDTDTNLNIWVCGDCNGTFRGLIPAFISGYYAGKISSSKSKQNPIEKHKLNQLV